MVSDGSNSIRWMTAVSVWLFLGMTSAMITAKVSLIWLLRLYKYEQIHPATWYIIIMVLLEAPLFSHVIHLVWNTPFINGPRFPLPKKSLIILGVLGSVSESVAGVVFAAEVSYVLPEPVLLLIPAAVFTLHLVLCTSSKLKESSNEKAKGNNKIQGKQSLRNCVCILMSSYLLWTPMAVATILHIWSTFNLTLGVCIVLPPALLVLSATWSPHLQAAVVRVKARGQGESRKNQSLSLIYTLFRISTIPFTLYLIMFFKIDAFRNDALAFLHHFIHDVRDPRVWLPVLLSSVSGLVVIMIGGVASKVALLTPGMRIPALVTPVVSLGVAAVLWKDIESEAFWELSGSDVVTWTASCVALTAWMIPFVIPGIPVLRTPRKLLRPFSDNFHSFSWRPFFLEQHLMLNTIVEDGNNDEEVINRCTGALNSSTIRNSTVSGKPTDSSKMKRVYICTTMYRETEAEMRRYLNSLKKVFTSERLLQVDLETHIFLDNSIDEDLQVNSYVQQLLSLLTTVLHITPAALQRHATPYGCQVTCRCLGGHLLFVHCKNGREFKPKKRWSQVMYMNFILKHRATHPSRRPNSPDTLTSPEKWKENYQSNTASVQCSSDLETEHGGRIWFSSGQVLPIAGSEALRRMFKLPANPHRQADESGSESALGSSHDTSSDGWREAYAVSTAESSSPCASSDTDDDSDANSFRGMSKVMPRKSSREEKAEFSETRSSPENTNTATNSICSETGNTSASSGRKGRKTVSQIPLSNVQNAGRGHSEKDSKREDFWDAFGSHFQNSSTTSVSSICQIKPISDDVYILATDADTEFNGESMRILLDQCEADHSLGAVCGRTIPVGGLKPIVWYQKFEYAKDFWLVKSSQNVIGTVTCCPGCFSMYRTSALSDVMDTFSQPSTSAYDTLVKDHGEDRWLCTLMMQKGWKLEYADNCHNSTHCPETCGEFLRQRRRWVLSELSNMMLIFQGLGHLIKGNATFSTMFILSLLHMFVWVLLSPSTTLVVICVSFHILFYVPMTYTAPVAYCLLLGLFVVCVTQPRPTQRMVTQAIVAVMIGIMTAVSVGFVDYVVTSLRKDLEAGQVEFKPYFLVLFLIGGTIYAALLHASEAITLLYGIVYAAIFPAMFLALPVYSIANMVDTSWGTRELTGSKACCDVMMDDTEDNIENERVQFKFKTSDLPALSAGDAQQMDEHRFWMKLKQTLLGCNVNCGESDRNLRRGLFNLRNRCVLVLFITNSLWYAILTSIYLFVSSDVVCYAIASLFSFSLIVQIVGMTSYKVDELLKRYIVRKMQHSESIWVREKSSTV